MQYYLGIDIGASSGRHMLAHMEDGKMVLEEVYRFANGQNEKNGHLCWDTVQLYKDILAGMAKCKELGKIPVSVGIDTWAVDFVLLDEKNQVLGDTVGYRDARTEKMDEEVYQIIPEAKLYGRNGIQKAIFNTIYQLMAVKKNNPEHLAAAKTFLMIPDYFNYLLCGVKANEYTNASTTQLVTPATNDWDYELMEMLGYPKDIFQEIQMPGTVLGELLPEVAAQVGYSCKVILPATHDTGSAVLAVPSNDPKTVYISSGTWSLMGVEEKAANCSAKSREYNFTNEGGYDHRFRYLKNIMGLWMIQSVKKEIAQDMSFGEICDLAAKESISSIVDCDDNRFLAPKNMTEEVRKACAESGQQVPEGIAQVASVIYNSLAVCYGETIKQIEEMTGNSYSRINVVGGGANAAYLNEITAKRTGKEVYAGPGEATVIGNIMVQMMITDEFQGLEEARDCVAKSFDVKKYQP